MNLLLPVIYILYSSSKFIFLFIFYYYLYFYYFSYIYSTLSLIFIFIFSSLLMYDLIHTYSINDKIYVPNMVYHQVLNTFFNLVYSLHTILQIY